MPKNNFFRVYLAMIVSNGFNAMKLLQMVQVRKLKAQTQLVVVRLGWAKLE
jgi:hypothetical protein